MKTRRLAALMFTDMVGYSAIAHKDEWLARELVDDQRLIVREAIERFGGTEQDTAGDGFFIEFPSAVSAVECAVDIQSRLFDRNRFKAPERKIQLRIGLHLGDVGSEGDDLFGNGVNLAARIEPLAPAGGICVTQQIFDQVDGKIDGVQFKKRGHYQLKNIETGAVIYSVISPWDHSEAPKKLANASRWLKALPLFENMSSALGIALFAICVGCLAVAISSSMTETAGARPTGSRAPASVASGNIDLSTGWMFQVASDQSRSLDLQKPEVSSWRDFDTSKTWRFSDQIQGRYWLRRTFDGTTALTTPAIVLGLISDKHRAFLNGHFIGGADRTSDLTLYPFDPKFLQSGENEILIEGETRSSLNPGLVTLGGVGTFLGDFSQARAAIAKNELQFGLLRTLYFVFAVFIFLISFAYAIFKRQSRAYFYYAFVLLLGSLQLAYFSPVFTAAFDYPFTRFLKIVGLTLTPLILYASYESQSGRKRAEFWATFAAVLLTSFSAVALFSIPRTTTDFTSNYNLLIAIGVALNLFFIGRVAKNTVKAKKDQILSHVFVLTFLLISLLTSMASFKQGWSTILLPKVVRDSSFWLSLASPLLFAVAVMAIAVIDHIREAHRAREKKTRDEFTLNVLHIVHESKTVQEAVFEVHKKLSKHVGATRSTLYLVNDVKDLLVFHSIGDQFANGSLAGATLKSHRVIRHVLDTNTPVLVNDIRHDQRFQDRQSAVEPTSYRTGSCIVIPLQTLGQVPGVLTFADKADRTPFTETEFKTAFELASTLALILTSSKDSTVGNRGTAALAAGARL